MKYNPRNNEHRKILADKIKEKLLDCGFVTEKTDFPEIVYSREVNNTGCRVLVYTSIGKKTNMVRVVDSDAIRVCSIDEDQRGVTKDKRINRVGKIEDITERMYQRMRSSYADTINAYKIKCNKCGANTFLSKKGNRICSDLCWNKKKE